MAVLTDVAGDALQRLTGIVAASSDYTVSFWYRPTATPPPGTIAIPFITVGDPLVYNTYVMMIRDENGNFRAAVAADFSGTGEQTIGPVFIDTNVKAYYITYTRSGTTHSLYVNGVLIGAVTEDFSAVADPLDTTMLGDDTYLNQPNEQFSRFREWTEALIQAEIKKEMHSDRPVRTADLWTNTPLPTNADVADTTVNNNDWTIVGTLADAPDPQIMSCGGIRTAKVGAVATGTTSLSIAPPAGLADWDILIMSLSHKGAGFATVPAGWEVFGQDISGATRGEWYWKRASSEAGNYSVTGLATCAAGQITAYSGATRVGSPILVSTVRANASGTNGTLGITPTLPYCLILASQAHGLNVSITGFSAFLNNPELNEDLTWSVPVFNGGSSSGSGCRIAGGQAQMVVPYTTPPSFSTPTSPAENVAIFYALIPETTYSGFTGSKIYAALIPPQAVWEGPPAAVWNGLSYGPYSGPVQQRYLMSGMASGSGRLQRRDWVTNKTAALPWNSMYMQVISPPLAEQTISGNYDVMHQLATAWNDGTLGQQDLVEATYRIYIYVTDGQAVNGAEPPQRVVLLDYTGSTSFNYATLVGTALSAPQALATELINEDDSIVIEFGAIVTVAPGPVIHYPVQDYAEIRARAGGACPDNQGVAFNDGTSSSSATDFAPFHEFSHTIVLKGGPLVDVPTNDTCATATVIPSAPYQGGWQSTEGISNASRKLWWEYTAEEDGFLFFHTFGSNSGLDVEAYTGGCGSLTGASGRIVADNYRISRSLSFVGLPVTQGVTYTFRTQSGGINFNGAKTAPIAVRVGLFYRQAAQFGDIFVPSGNLAVYRDGQLINLSAEFDDELPTGIAIDPRSEPMDDLNGGIHAGPRVYMGLHNFPLVEILDIDTLNIGEFEIDFMNDSIRFTTGVAGLSQHFSQLAIHDGNLTVACFGDGYQHVNGDPPLPAFYNFISDVQGFQSWRTLPAINGDNQPGNPFTSTASNPTATISPWALDVRANGDAIYSNSGFYVGPGEPYIAKFTVPGVQGPLFATLPLAIGPNPGVKGLAWLPGGGCLACVGNVVVRLNSAGAIVWVYTPTYFLYSQNLVDVIVMPDGIHGYVVDVPSLALWKFRLADGVEVALEQTFLASGVVTQIAVFAPESQECPGTRGDPVIGA